jgi:hypothetical protein
MLWDAVRAFRDEEHDAAHTIVKNAARVCVLLTERARPKKKRPAYEAGRSRSNPFDLHRVSDAFYIMSSMPPP